MVCYHTIVVDKPTLRAVSRSQGNNQAVRSGLVAPRGYELHFEDVPILVDAFRRMVRRQEYDVCEMAITTYLCAKRYGKPFTALPIFLVRGFHHGTVLVHRSGGIEHPKQLEGTRVGISRGYTVTTGVWARGVLHQEYGVDLRTIDWLPSGDEHVEEFVAPANVTPLPAGSSLEAMLLAGELSAAIGARIDHPDVVPLLPAAAGHQALAERGHYPINHLVVVRDDLLREHPDLAQDLLETFHEAKQRYVARLGRAQPAELTNETDRMYRRVLDITGKDPLPYGLRANEQALDELLSHAVSQGILDQRPADLRSLFAADEVLSAPS